jgi:outer membrane receptor protein involved in Fe transport
MQNAPIWCNLKTALKITVGAYVLIGAVTQVSAQTVENAASANVGQASKKVHEDSSKGPSSETDDQSDITVTGTHIVGADTASPTYRYSQEDIQKAGQADLGEFIRSLPYNFSGGQNPGVMQGTVGITNANGTNASAPNLRGLGPDATLTLLNGHRLPYNGIFQSIDISAIPLAAVSNVQIVPDGASAIYGSDAVGGVVNIMLKRDFEGIETSARIGTTTQGGGFDQQYDLTAGTIWTNGGIMVAGQYQRQNPVLGSQREFTADLPRPADLLAKSNQYSLLVTAHQQVGDLVELSVDGHYNHRRSYTRFAPPADYVRYDNQSTDESFAVTPMVTVRFPANWTITVSGTYGKDDNDSRSGTILLPQGDSSYSTSCNCNETRAAELGASGALAVLPGGPIELAFGGGYREDTFRAISRDTGTSSTGGTRRNYYAYGEINVPLVSASNAKSGIERLVVTGAARYEHYNDFGSVTTPKLGLIYSPLVGLAIKGSWGKSFKAPTLVQLFQSSSVYLYPANWMGAPDLPASAAVIMPYGGNPNLRPERSDNWSVSADFDPVAIRGLHLSVSYFEVKYRDRVIQPINISTALSDPQFSDFISYNPDLAAQNKIIQGTIDFENLTPVPYDPANVIAVAEDRYINAARQNIRGIDVSGEYKFKAAGGDLSISGFASWLESSQKISPSTPESQLAGVIFNPPHFRARASAAWNSEWFRSAAYINYLGPVRDNRTQPNVDGADMVTIDLALGVALRTGAGPDRDADISLTVQNLLDKDPPFLQSTAANFAKFDSTNYSSLGRIISVTIRKKW